MGLRHREQCVSSFAVLTSELTVMSYPCPHTTTDGVYKSGFARSQQAYEDAVYKLFDSLDRLETILTGKDYLVGDKLTEADVRLFVTIVRTCACALHPPSLADRPTLAHRRSASTWRTTAPSSATSARSATGTPPSTCKPSTVLPATVQLEYVHADKSLGAHI